MVDWQGSLRMTTSLKVPKEALIRPRTTNGNITNSENTEAITRGTTSVRRTRACQLGQQPEHGHATQKQRQHETANGLPENPPSDRY
jgi:hypothetical protein